jgi:ribose 1,5-bisphosphokinase PhnN
MHELDDLYSKLNDAKADYRRHRFDMQHTKDQTEIMNSGDLASSSQRLSQTIESSIDRYRSSHGCE